MTDGEMQELDAILEDIDDLRLRIKWLRAGDHAAFAQCCGGACDTEPESVRIHEQYGDVVIDSTSEPEFTVPLELLETKSFDAVRID
jgi:hypothetical protein